MPHLLRSTARSVALLAAPIALSAQQPRPSTGEPWRIVTPPQSSLVFARDGSLVGEIGREWRTLVSIRSLPRYVPNAFVAVEDQRFYQHDGVDVIGVLGAVRDNLRGERRGASTITQQLVGNMHPDVIDRRDISLGRKLREQAAAREMERRYTKEQILEAYLNQVDLGHNWFGVEAAARHYFGKSAARLTIAEAASLAALPKSPPIYSPINNPSRNRDRRNVILELMAQQGYITRGEAEAAKREPVTVVPDGGMSARAGYFVDAVRTEAERAGIPVTQGGYRIHTTLEPSLQREAVAALLDGTQRLEARTDYRHRTYRQALQARTADYLQGSVVAMDPQTGDVRALVGGRDHARAPFERATRARRQPGSAIKPLVFGRALEAGLIAPTDVVPDTALAIPLPNGQVYRPRNADGRFLGPMTIRDALATSRNTVAIQVGLQTGMDSVAELSQRLGIDSPMQPYPSSAIGASVLRPLELVAAYTAFANDGAVVTPRFVTRIEDATGRVVRATAPSIPRPAMDPRAAFIVRSMLVDAAERGTGTAARRAVPPAVPVAGKTGTTNDNVDVWFVGMTPELVAGVWIGFDTPKTITPGAGGGTLAAPIWGQMMGRWYAGRESRGWPSAPAGLVMLELDRTTGLAATDTTAPGNRYVEYFIPGTEPAELRENPWKVVRWGIF